MSKYQSSNERLATLRAQLLPEFAKHELLDEQYWERGTGARWLIGKPNTFVFRTEVIAGIGGSLLVHGDIDLCRYAHYGDQGDAWSRLRWMGECQDLDYYVAQKASIGLRSLRARELEYDSEVACYDLDRLVEEYRQDPDTDPELIQLLSEAKMHTEYEHELWHFIRDGDRWDLWEHHIGRIVPVNIIVTHVALQRLTELLKARHGEAGPPECRTERTSP